MARAAAKTGIAKTRQRSPSTRSRAAKEAFDPGRTPQRILDAAEKLFGEQTFDAISMRDIAAEAGVNLGLVHYHFGAKEALFEQVVARRAKVLGDIRRARLDALKAQEDASVEGLMDAFMRPLFELTVSGETGWRSYVLLLAQLGQTNRWLHLLDRYFDETARYFLKALGAALPRAGKKNILYGFNFALLTMLNSVAQNRRLDSLSQGKIVTDDVMATYPRMLRFVCAGLRSLETPEAEKGRRR